MRKTYLSDISREQFGQVKDLLEPARKKTRPRTVLVLHYPQEDMHTTISGFS